MDSQVSVQISVWVQIAISFGQLCLGYLVYRRSEATQPLSQRVPTLFAAASIRRYWPLVLMLVLVLVSWVPFLIGVCPPDYIIGWGRAADPTRVWIVADGHKLLGKRPNELVLIARTGDNTVDTKRDTEIVRSGTFEILDRNIRIEAPVSSPEHFSKTLKFGTEFYLLVVPQDFPLESVHSLADAEKHGGKIVGSKFSD
jgi:hypothetical protein